MILLPDNFLLYMNTLNSETHKLPILVCFCIFTNFHFILELTGPFCCCCKIIEKTSLLFILKTNKLLKKQKNKKTKK